MSGSFAAAGADLAGSAAWGAYNMVTECLDQQRPRAPEPAAGDAQARRFVVAAQAWAVVVTVSHWPASADTEAGRAA